MKIPLRFPWKLVRDGEDTPEASERIVVVSPEPGFDVASHKVDFAVPKGDEAKLSGKGSSSDQDLAALQLTMAVHVLCIKILFGVVLVMTIVLVTFVFVLFGRNHELKVSVRALETKMDNLSKPADEIQGLCFACSVADREVVGGLKISEYFQVDRKRGRCCVKDVNAFMRLLTTAIYRQVNREITHAKGICPETQKDVPCTNGDATPRANCSRPAAHFVVKGQTPALNSSDEGQTLREWSGASRDGAFRKGIGFEDGRLVIQIPGNYFVYSQVYFVETYYQEMSLLPPREDARGNQPKRVWHEVYKFNADFPKMAGETVLKNMKSKCWSTAKDFGMHTSYVGAVLKLKAGDQLGVTVSNASLIPLDTAATYFGAYMI